MIDKEKLYELLEFNFETGKMYWRRRPNARSQWNGRYAGKEAFTAKRGGYFHGAIGGRLFQAHRVIYAAAHGEWPELIDHINQDTEDNRLANLRAASKSINSHNSKCRVDSRTGIKGVSWSKRQSAFRAYLTVGGKQIHLGYHPTVEAASAAREAAFRKHMEPKG